MTSTHALLGLTMLATAAVMSSCATSTGPHLRPANAQADAEGVESVLNALHAAASKADATVYWSLFAPDAVFLGTDASERWTLEQFRAYATPYFEKGQGWTYAPVDRHIAVGADGRTAWFDESLTNAKYGPCRGTGVLVRTREGWKIAQYNLTVPIPNDLLADVARQIKDFESKK